MSKLSKIIVLLIAILIIVLLLKGLVHAEDRYAVVTESTSGHTVYNVFSPDAMGEHWHEFEEEASDLKAGDEVIVTFSSEDYKNFTDWYITSVNTDKEEVDSFKSKLKDNIYFY